MKQKKYVLSVDLVINGKDVTVPLATYDLIALQKYTAFCNNPEDLLKFMPNDENFSVKNFLGKYIKSFKEGSSDPFSIRTSNSNKAKKVRIIYKKDADVLLANIGTLTNRIIDYFNVSINDCVSGNVDDKTQETLMELYQKFGGINLAEAIEDVKTAKLNMDGDYDERYEVPSRNRWMFIGLSPKCVSALVKDAFTDNRKRIELAFLLKDKTGNLLPSLTSYEKDKLIEKIDNNLKRRKASASYIRSSIKRNISNFRLELKIQNSKPEENEKYEHIEITEEQIIDYNRQRLLKTENPVLERITDLSEKIEWFKRDLENLIDEEKSLERQPNFMESDEVVMAIKEQINLKKIEISQLEYELNELETGNVIFSDAGFVVGKGKNI